MTIKDYMIILKEEEEWEELPNSRILEWFYYSNSESNKSHLTERVKAKINLQPLSKNFPLLFMRQATRQALPKILLYANFSQAMVLLLFQVQAGELQRILKHKQAIFNS